MHNFLYHFLFISEHSRIFQSLIDFAFGIGYFCSLWVPLALAEVTVVLHLTIFETTGNAITGHNSQKIRKYVDWWFIGFCIVANLIRNALWVTNMEVSDFSDKADQFQSFYSGIEWMTLMNIALKTMLVNPTEYRHQARVSISILSFNQHITTLLSRQCTR
jgi:uncharacterized membrane protein